MQGQQNIKANIILASIFLTVSLWLMFYAIPTQIRLSSMWSTVDSGVNSQTFPYFATTIMGSAALIQLVSNIRKLILQKKSKEEVPKKKVVWANEIRALIVFALCAAYGVLFITIGYIYATIIIPPIILFVLGSRKWYHYLTVYGIGALMYVIFQFLLRIRLP